jgi:choline dehydrogenase-like flavoprotein
MSILHGRKQVGDLVLETDVVVVGSGAGGAVVAAELADAGQRVIVVEEGPYHTPEAMGAMKPSESLRHVWRAASMTAAVGIGNSPVINVMMGRCVGGSSVVTGGVCFRIPEQVLARWSGEMGLSELTPQGLEPHFEAVERAIHVETVPADMRSRSTTLFGAGAKRLGFELSPIRRNTHKCRGRSKCNFVCPHGAKRSVDVTYLPRAAKAGTRILADALVDQVLLAGDRAVGISGALLDETGRRRSSLTIAARRVVLAAGAWHTPIILRDSGIGRASRQVGRNMTLHPSVRVVGEFDELVDGWEGAMQSAFTDALQKDRLTLMSIFVPQSILGATMPGAGPEFMRKAGRIRHLAIFGGMVHDEGGGRLWRGFGREPVVTYRMAPQDRAALSKLIRVLAEAYLAAGARKVYLPVFGLEGVDAAGLKALDFDRLPGRKIECTSQHPLGTCRMGVDPKTSVVDPDGETWDVRELYIADGSILPTSLGVNPQVGVMAMAARIAWKLRDRKLPDRR